MSEEIFLLHDVGEGLTEAEIVTWKVAVGDVVTLNQPLVDIETAKATVELPSPYAGTVVALHGNVGDVLEVHTPLITFEIGGGSSAAPTATTETTPSTATAAAPAAATSDKTEGSVGEGREAVLIGYGVANEDAVVTRKHRRQGAAPVTPTAPAPAVPVPAAASVATLPDVAPRSTPPVRLYAKQHGLDISSLSGTGRDGLITRNDVEQALSGAPSAPARVSAPITGPNKVPRPPSKTITNGFTDSRMSKTSLGSM